MIINPKRGRRIKSFILGSIIPGIIILGIILHLSQAFLIPTVVISSLILGAMALWARANKNADGSEWWQDNESSGWRGY